MKDDETSAIIEALMDEQRKFKPSVEFVRQANIGSEAIYAEGKDYINF